MTVAVWAGVVVIGGVGAVLRFLVDRTVSGRVAGSLPYGTLVVNFGDLADAIKASTAVAAVGRMPENYKQYLIVTTNEAHSVDDIANIVVSLALGLAAASLGLWIGGRL